MKIIRIATTLLAFTMFLQTVNVGVVLAEETDQSTTKPTFASEGDSELDVLRQQNAALESINQKLRQRVQELEQRMTDYDKDEQLALTPWEATEEMAILPETEREEATTAIEEALISKGLVLIPYGRFRYTPAFSWSHSGSGSDTSDSYAFSHSLAYGLPWGMSISAGLLYVWRDTPNGSNDGVGDSLFSLKKKLTNESESFPSLVASLNYTHDSGVDTFTPVSIGSGFRSLRAGLSASKRFDPVVYYGRFFYNHVFEESVTFSPPAWIATKDGDILFESGDISPGDGYGLSLGVSLAVTPRISLDSSVSLNYKESTQYAPNGYDVTFESSTQTIGYFSLGTGVKLTKDLFLSISALAGVTDDSADFFFSTAMPYRF